MSTDISQQPETGYSPRPKGPAGLAIGSIKKPDNFHLFPHTQAGLCLLSNFFMRWSPPSSKVHCQDASGGQALSIDMVDHRQHSYKCNATTCRENT